MKEQFERKVIQKLSHIENIVQGLDTLNRNIEKLIKILIEKEEKKE